MHAAPVAHREREITLCDTGVIVKDAAEKITARPAHPSGPAGTEVGLDFVEEAEKTLQLGSAALVILVLGGKWALRYLLPFYISGTVLMVIAPDAIKFSELPSGPVCPFVGIKLKCWSHPACCLPGGVCRPSPQGSGRQGSRAGG